MYSKRVLDHFHDPRNVGEIENATAAVEASNPVCGDTVKLWVVIENGAITAARFKAAGCVAAIACGSWLTEWLAGKPLAALPNLSPDQIEAALDGLPPASKHAAVLACDAVRQLAARRPA
jgi:nitrogen fixation NifU-like protein